MEMAAPLWEQPVLRSAAGETLRPGGFLLTDRAAERIGMVPGWRVLDVGSGLGASVARLRSRFGVEAYGVEPSAVQVERCGVPGIVRAGGDRLPFQDGVFQAVFCECVLSLFDDPQAGLREFYRVLNAHGFLVLSDVCNTNRGMSDSRSCAERAIPFAETLDMVKRCGFIVREVEDHSSLLKELAAKLVLAGGKVECACRGRSFGYYMMIVQKTGSDNV